MIFLIWTMFTFSSVFEPVYTVVLFLLDFVVCEIFDVEFFSEKSVHDIFQVSGAASFFGVSNNAELSPICPTRAQ